MIPTTYHPSISIHAPPRGATHELHNGNADEIFQFTPLREGRRLDYDQFRLYIRISIHAPPRGATSVGVSVLEIPTSFQFTPLREGRHLAKKRLTSRLEFQFTPLREGRLRF